MQWRQGLACVQFFPPLLKIQKFRMEGGNNNRTGLSCTILYIPSTYFAYSMCTLLSFLIQKTQKYLVKWEKRGGYVTSKLHVYRAAWRIQLSTYLWPGLYSHISIPELLAKTPFLQFPHQASFPIFRSAHLTLAFCFLACLNSYDVNSAAWPYSFYLSPTPELPAHIFKTKYL